MIKTGNTFLIPDKSGKRHLWVILPVTKTNPKHLCVLVNLSSKKCPAKNCSMVLSSRDHPFLKKDSFVRCDHSRTLPLKNLEALLKKGKIAKKEDMKETVLTKVRKTVLACRMTSKEVKVLLT